MFFYFAIITIVTVLLNAGNHNINTAEEAARAFRPPFPETRLISYFGMGVIRIGFPAIPVLASVVNAMSAESLGREKGLNKTFNNAPLILYYDGDGHSLSDCFFHSTGSPVHALICTNRLNGITAPVLIALILHICNNKKLMGDYTNSCRSNLSGTATLVLSLFLFWYTPVN